MKKIRSFFSVLKSAFKGFIEGHELIRRLFNDSLSEGEFNRISNYPFFVYAYDNDSLRFWNTNTIIAPLNDSANDGLNAKHYSITLGQLYKTGNTLLLFSKLEDTDGERTLNLEKALVLKKD